MQQRPADDLDLNHRIERELRAFLGDVAAPVRVVSGDLAAFTDVLTAFVLDGGKRLRPAFCYWGYRAAGGADDKKIVTAAAALELLQASALVHDDVIDASDTRRGAPSVHRRFMAVHEQERWAGDAVAFGTAAAVLLGDLALVWADVLFNRSAFSASALARARSIWDDMRTEVMCGQYLDVVGQARGTPSAAAAWQVVRYKSSSYTVERPLQLGAALAGAGDTTLDTLAAYGAPLGEAFQLRDDLLGIYGDPDETGKPAGDDLREGKRTVLVALAYERATGAQREQLDRDLGRPDLDDDNVRSLRDAIAATGAVDEVEQLISARLEQALSALDSPHLAATAAVALRRLAEAATQRRS